MSTPEVKNGAMLPKEVSGAKQAPADVPKQAEQKQAATPTGITAIKMDLQSPEARAALQQTLLDFGLTADFLTTTEGGFATTLDSKGQAQLRQLASSAAALTAPGTSEPSVAATSDLQGHWADFVAGQGVTGAVDVNSLVQFVLREAYMENTKDLHFYAQKVRFYNSLKKNIREELTNARKRLSGMAGLDDANKGHDTTWKGDYRNTYAGDHAALRHGPIDFPPEPDYNAVDGMVPQDAMRMSDVSDNKEGLETYIKSLEEKLNSVGDDAQLANVDLQNMLQKQQQTLQMMSNISKMLHDTAMAIIRKIGS